MEKERTMCSVLNVFSFERDQSVFVRAVKPMSGERACSP